MKILEKLEQLGCIIRIESIDVENATFLANALRMGGIQAAEISWDSKTGGAVLTTLQKEGLLVGAVTKTAPQTQDAFQAGADWVVSVERESGNVVRSALVVNSTERRARVLVRNLWDLRSAVEQIQHEQYVQLEIFGDLGEAAVLEIGKMGRGCCAISLINEEIAQQNWEGITTKCKAVVRALLQLRLHHVGIDCADRDDGYATAVRASELLGLCISKETPTAYFVDGFLEIMKGKGAGHKGHISLSTPCIQRAIRYLEAAGVTMRAGSGQYNDKGELFVIYLEEEIAGFAIHLIQV